MRILMAKDKHIAEIIEIWKEFMDYNANIDTYDTQSEEYQLYSIGIGRVWAWHYQGGRYSGSLHGPAYDIRPQIVNIY